MLLYGVKLNLNLIVFLKRLNAFTYVCLFIYLSYIFSVSIFFFILFIYLFISLCQLIIIFFLSQLILIAFFFSRMNYKNLSTYLFIFPSFMYIYKSLSIFPSIYQSVYLYSYIYLCISFYLYTCNFRILIEMGLCLLIIIFQPFFICFHILRKSIFIYFLSFS